MWSPPAYHPGDSGQKEEQSSQDPIPLCGEMSRDGFWRTESEKCLTVRRIGRQAPLQGRLDGIDEVFTRLFEDSPVSDSMLPEFFLKPAQILLKCRRPHAGRS